MTEKAKEMILARNRMLEGLQFQVQALLGSALLDTKVFRVSLR